MPIPKPSASLDNACLVIHDNTLYAYTPGDFLSISLSKNAEWKKLATGVQVTGPACMGSTPADPKQAGFYTVGGKGGPEDFSGLQKYTYSTGEWTSVKLVDRVTKNRQGHAATYIKANDVIVMYAGNQDGNSGFSSQTFSIQASEPHAVLGHESGGAPPAESPLMFSWSDADAAMITGADPGDSQGAKVWLFNPTAHWRDSGVRLKVPLEDKASKRLALVTTDDGSKFFYVFDMKASPVAVERIRVQDAKGAPVHDSASVGRRDADDASLDDVLERRQTWDAWPKYNSTFAPASMPPGMAMASDRNGMIVFAGQDNLEIFDTKGNTWHNASAMLGPPEQKAFVLAPAPSLTTTPSHSSSSSSSSTSSVTSTHPPTSSTIEASRTTSTVSAASSSSDPAAVAEAESSRASTGPSSNTILGITLGCILGFMALLGLLLLLLRRRRRQRQSFASADEKDLTDLSPSPAPAKPVMGQYRGHFPKSSRESWSSAAILMGRVGKDRPGLNRRASDGSNGSSNSSLHKILKSTISKPVTQSATHPVVAHDEKNVAFAPDVGEPRPRPRNNVPADANDNTRRSSGWNRYWSGGSALQMLGLGASKRKSAVSEQSSRYSETGQPARVRRDSATVPALNLDKRPEVNSVVTGSPVLSVFTNDPRQEGMSGKIVRPTSRASSGYSSGIPESVHEAWGGRGAASVGTGSWSVNRAAVSATDSGGTTTSLAAHLPPSQPPSQPPPHPPPHPGVSQQPQLAMAAKSSDMSWLNLGDQARR